MGRDLSRWERSAKAVGSVHAGTDPPVAGASRSVDSTDWSGQAVTIEETGLALPEGGGEVITSAVERRASVRRRGDAYYRRRTGWVAQRARIVTFVQDQPLRARSDGRFAPAGRWGFPTLTVYDAVDRIEVRAGDVPVDPEVSALSASSSTGRAAGSSGVVTSRADDELAFLPAAVRRSVRARAVDPVYFDAEALRYERPDGSSYHTVSAVRLDRREGIVVLASRQAGGGSWQAEQFVYRFTAGPSLESPSQSTERLGWS